MHRPAFLLLLPLALLLSGCGDGRNEKSVSLDADPAKVNADLALMKGTWVYERHVVEGKEVPVAEMGPARVVVNGFSMVRHVFGPDGKELTPVRSRLELDPTKTPKQMDDIASVGTQKARRHGIYEITEDRLTLCYDNVGDERPTAFESAPGSPFVLTVLKRK